VSAALQRIAGVPDISARMRPIMGAVEQYHYRNKLEVRLRSAGMMSESASTAQYMCLCTARRCTLFSARPLCTMTRIAIGFLVQKTCSCAAVHSQRAEVGALGAWRWWRHSASSCVGIRAPRASQPRALPETVILQRSQCIVYGSTACRSSASPGHVMLSYHTCVSEVAHCCLMHTHRGAPPACTSS
jgi:hypothetical protein